MATNPANQQPTRAQMAAYIRAQRTANRQRGCLLGILWTLLFGVFYWVWLACKWTWKASVALALLCWRWLVAYPVAWSWRGGRALAAQVRAWTSSTK